MLTGLEDAAAAIGLDRRALLERASRFVHATTQSTNAVLARTGAKTAVLTTRGFGDTLMIMRSTGRVAGLSVLERHHYRKTDKPKPLANERDIFEIIERVDYAGRVVTPLDQDGVFCGHCGQRHCAPADNLLAHLREVLEPLTAAGPVRGEAYDQGRFCLRQLCCGACGALVDAQVALDGAPWPFLRIDRTPG